MIFMDGDVLAYRAAFSAEIVKWGIYDTDGECYIHCDSKQQALDIAGVEEYVERTSEPLPFSRAVLHLNNDIAEIAKNCCAYLKSPTVATHIFLSHPDKDKNDRFKIAKTHPYKGNRKNMRPPYHKEAILDYMYDMENVSVVEGIEADDALCTYMFGTPGSICASIDKDLLMCPGLHYNFNSKEVTVASDPGSLELKPTKSGKKLIGTGFVWFCAQMLMGDPVDNIVGLRGYGPVRAYKILSESDVEKTPRTINNLWNLVKNHYIMESEGMSRVYENADLLWIRRNEDEHFGDWMDVHYTRGK